MYDTSKVFQKLFGSQTFGDFQDFEAKFNAFQQETGVVFRIKSSVSVGAENKKRTIKIHDKFKYGGVTYICVRHGTNKVKGASCNCKAYLSLSYKTSIQKLYITSTNTQHNHPLPIKNPEILVIQNNIEIENPYSAAFESSYGDAFYLGRAKLMEPNSVEPPNSEQLEGNLKRELDTDATNKMGPSKMAKFDTSTADENHRQPSTDVPLTSVTSKPENKPGAITSSAKLSGPGSHTINSGGGKVPITNQQQHPQQLHSLLPQSKYAQLLAVIEDMGRDIRPAYAGSKVAAERLKRGIIHSRILVRECLLEAEKCART